MPLFGKGGPKNPQELVKSMNDALSVLGQTPGGAKKAEKVRAYTFLHFALTLYVLGM